MYPLILFLDMYVSISVWFPVWGNTRELANLTCFCDQGMFLLYPATHIFCDVSACSVDRNVLYTRQRQHCTLISVLLNPTLTIRHDSQDSTSNRKYHTLLGRLLESIVSCVHSATKKTNTFVIVIYIFIV